MSPNPMSGQPSRSFERAVAGQEAPSTDGPATGEIALRRLAEEVDKIEVMAGLLGTKLSPILAPPVPEVATASGDDNKNPISEFGDCLRGLTRRIAGLSTQLHDLASRISI